MDPAARQYLDAMQLVQPIDEATKLGDSEVQRFYQGAVLFLTGGTGFIGKQLLEKLFRSCEIKKAFVLIRPKKGSSPEKRLQDMLNDPVFEPVRKKKPDLTSRIVGVEGDVASLHLGISNDDWNMIVREVDIIFHVAATIRFDEKLRTAAIINVRGTREALALGRACHKLRSFVHVSTAYSHATSSRTGNEVREQFYPSPVPADTLLTFVDSVDEERLNTVTQSLISGWPNTYTFTKAVAESLVEAERGYLPVCIVRPAIVWSTYREPVPGWLDASCIYGAMGVVLGSGLGVLRVFYSDEAIKLALVPVDLVNNATIVAGWQAGVRGLQDPLIYNVSSSSCGVTLRSVSGPLCSPKTRSIAATPVALWYFYLIMTKSRVLYWFLSWILHFIPAYIVDLIINVFKVKKPRGFKSLVQIYTKFEKLTSVISYFTTHEWNLDDTNVQNLWQKMSDTDRTIYNFEMGSIDWDHNMLMSALGMRKYIVKDNLEGTKEAVAKQRWLKLANYAVLITYLVVFWVILSWLLWFVKLML